MGQNESSFLVLFFMQLWSPGPRKYGLKCLFFTKQILGNYWSVLMIKDENSDSNTYCVTVLVPVTVNV